MGGDPYIGQLLLVAFAMEPVGWAFCNGQLLPISTNEALFQLLGTTYGGDGVKTFGLPDLRGRVPVHAGGSSFLGQTGGAESVSLTLANYPQHGHFFYASSQNYNSTSPSGNAIASGAPAYSSTGVVQGQLANSVISTTSGGTTAHENRQPFLAMNWIISLAGAFPTPN